MLINEKALLEKDEAKANLLRAFGYTLTTSDIKQHALQASEYALKALLSVNVSAETVQKMANKQKADLETLACFIVAVDK